MKVFIVFSILIFTVLGAPSDNARIIGGEDAKRGDYPFVVLLTWTFPGIPENQLCGGSIINNDWILTAAHCLLELPAPGTIFVTAGVTNRLNPEEEEWQKIEVVKRIVHEKYVRGANPYDIALLKLKTPLKFNEYVQKVALPSATDKTIGTVELIGWGSMTPDPMDPHFAAKLQQIELPVLDYDTCKKAISIFVEDNNLDVTNVCAGPLTGGHASCVGDSGGPLFQRNSDGITQRGIVSWGLSPCAMKGAPTVYTEVSHFVNWIDHVIKSQ